MMRMTPARLTRMTAAICVAAATLTACGEAANTGVRTGPQAVHPSGSALARGGQPAPSQQATQQAASPKGDLAETLFAQLCVGKTAAQSKAAIVASGLFGPPAVTEFKNTGARYEIFPYTARDRASVAVITGSIGGLQCSVGVDNKGPNLYEDGRITRSG